MANESDSKQREKDAVRALIRGLGSSDGEIRGNARAGFVKMGKEAIDYLSELVGAPIENLRLEAARALGEIGGPETAALLVEAMQNGQPDIRQAAATGLANMGFHTLKLLLGAFINHPENKNLRAGLIAVHAAMSDPELKQKLSPLAEALANQVDKYEIVAILRSTLDELG